MKRALSGRDVLLMVVGFFAVIFIVNAWFVTVSVRTFRGEDEQKPYLQGIEYNQTLSRRAEQKALGWRAIVWSDRMSSGKVRIFVTLHRPDGSPVEHVVLAGELRHPADENRDRGFSLRETQPGMYQTDLDRVAPGAWDVLAHGTENSAPFETSRRIWLR